jgi:dihydroorotate dehydrogenase (fumarate)
MGRKGYTAVDDFRGLLAVPVDVDETARERADYVSALRQANESGSASW